MESGIGGSLWAFLIIGGTVLLLAGLVYGSIQWHYRRRDPAIRAAQKRAVDRLYHDDDEPDRDGGRT